MHERRNVFMRKNVSYVCCRSIERLLSPFLNQLLGAKIANLWSCYAPKLTECVVVLGQEHLHTLHNKGKAVMGRSQM